MNLIAHQRPCIDRRPGFLSQCSESSHKISAIRLVIDNPPLFNAANNHVVQRDLSTLGVHADAEDLERAPESFYKARSVMIVAENHAPVEI